MKKTMKIAFFSLLAVIVIFNACEKLTQYYKISNHKCTSCATCITVCGYGAISIDSVPHDEIIIEGTDTFPIPHETTLKIDPSKCVACGECFKACPSNAISLVLDETEGENGNNGDNGSGDGSGDGSGNGNGNGGGNGNN